MLHPFPLVVKIRNEEALQWEKPDNSHGELTLLLSGVKGLAEGR
jgi:hypothetical protein